MFPLVNIKNQLIAIRSLRSPDQRTDHHPVDFGSNLRTQQTDNQQKNAYLFRFPKKDLLLLGQFAAFSDYTCLPGHAYKYVLGYRTPPASI